MVHWTITHADRTHERQRHEQSNRDYARSRRQYAANRETTDRMDGSYPDSNAPGFSPRCVAWTMLGFLGLILLICVLL